MSEQSIEQQCMDLEERISRMPAGTVTIKKVGEHSYYYHRWYEDGKRREKYVAATAAPALREAIAQRKRLEKELKKLKGNMKMVKPVKKKTEHQFSTLVRTGGSLRAFSRNVRGYKKRKCYQALYDFVFGDIPDKVFILYGLRRTGKTTLIRQILCDMTDADIEKTAFIQITAKNTLSDVNKDLRYLEEKGFCYVFLDEVTLMDDFIDGAALFSDVFATCGMKIVLSGTDSLGFLFTEDEQLYDRCIMLHTTFIPYAEFEEVLGISGIDEYIRYGGTMSLGGQKYNQSSTFATKRSTDEYVDTAIAKNIQHSLRCYQHEGHFRNLQELYLRDELTSAINRVVEDINHRFTLEVLKNDFVSHDLGVSATNLLRSGVDLKEETDYQGVTDQLRALLEVRNAEEQTVQLSGEHATEIQEYLELLDLIQSVEVISIADLNHPRLRTLIAQPGMRYAQADALIKSLLLDEKFSRLSLVERNMIQDRILNEIKGRMMEDIVLLETKTANPDKQVFVLQFPVGEFDMVIFDPASASCEIFEMKHSAERIANQYRHLIDPQKCAATEHRYGPIRKRTVLYRGENKNLDSGIFYRNVEEYLKELN